MKFVGPIVDDKEIKAAHFEDPDGNEMYFVEVKTRMEGLRQSRRCCLGRPTGGDHHANTFAA